MRELTIRELMQGIQVETGTTHQLRVAFPKLHVRLDIDPTQAQHWEDRFVLTMARHGTKTQTVMTVKDDHLAGDAHVDLVFKRLMPDGRYTLVVEAGAPADSYTMFEDLTYEELFDAAG